MANVFFKRGTQANLPASGTNSVVDGALYFTTDTKRLFLGNGTTLLPIAEGITTVTSVENLPAAAEHEGEFYYLAPSSAAGNRAGNILAYSDGTKWLQVNMSTFINTMSQTATMTNSNAVITLSITDNNSATKSASFTLVAGDNVTLSAAGSAVTISVPDDMDTLYTLSASAGSASETYTGGVSTIGLALTPTANSGNGTVASTVTLKESGSVAIITDTDGSISFAVKATGVSGINSFSMGTGDARTPTPSTSGFYAQLVTGTGAKFTPTIDPQIAYGENGGDTVHFNNGVATLSVYNISEVNEMLATLRKTMDAMEYRGTVSSWADANPLSTVANQKVGYTWKADDTFTIPAASSATGADIQVKPGYLIIARGSENSDGYLTAPIYDVVSGSVADTTYALSSSTNGVKLVDSGGSTRGSLTVTTVTTNLTVDDTTHSTGSASIINKVLAIDLANVTQTNTTNTWTQAAGSSTSVLEIITGVTVDSKGRVTGVETTSATFVDTPVNQVALSQSVTASSNVATLTSTINVNGTQSSKSITVGSAGNSIAVTATGTTGINVDLVWEEF